MCGFMTCLTPSDCNSCRALSALPERPVFLRRVCVYTRPVRVDSRAQYSGRTHNRCTMRVCSHRHIPMYTVCETPYVEYLSGPTSDVWIPQGVTRILCAHNGQLELILRGRAKREGLSYSSVTEIAVDT